MDGRSRAAHTGLAGGKGRLGVEGEETSRSGSLGWLTTAVVAALAVVVVVDAWATAVASRASQTLSANALRSVELAEEMRWQITRLTPAPGVSPALEPSTAEALLRLHRDVRAYDRLATSEAQRGEWSKLAALNRDLADAWSRGDEEAARGAASRATESAERLIALNHVEADAVHEQVAARDVCGAYVAAHPDQRETVLFGATCHLHLEALSGAELLARWARDERAEVAS